MQTSVLSNMPIGVAGQLADLHTEEFGDVVSATSEEASLNIPFGVAIQNGTSDDGVLLLTDNADVISGVVVYATLYDIPIQLAADGSGLLPGVTFDRLRKGKILVFTETAVTPASEVHVRFTDVDSTATPPRYAGGFRGTADAGDTIKLTAGAKWLTSAGIGELAVLSIDCDEIAFVAD